MEIAHQTHNFRKNLDSFGSERFASFIRFQQTLKHCMHNVQITPKIIQISFGCLYFLFLNLWTWTKEVIYLTKGSKPHLTIMVRQSKILFMCKFMFLYYIHQKQIIFPFAFRIFHNRNQTRFPYYLKIMLLWVTSFCQIMEDFTIRNLRYLISWEFIKVKLRLFFPVYK